jgi:hypothetical protein
MRSLVLLTLLGAGVTIAVLLATVGAGRLLGRVAPIPWVCDDTRYVDTVPAGRGVVGPAVSAAPGCGGQAG